MLKPAARTEAPLLRALGFLSTAFENLGGGLKFYQFIFVAKGTEIQVNAANGWAAHLGRGQGQIHARLCLTRRAGDSADPGGDTAWGSLPCSGENSVLEKLSIWWAELWVS